MCPFLFFLEDAHSPVPVSENKTESEWQVSSDLLVRANIIIIGIAVVSVVDEIQKFISNSPRL